jgi:hypothetical protein
VPGAKVLLSWFGAPESRFGGYGFNANRRPGLGGSPYRYRPFGDPEALLGLRIPIWDTKSLAGRWFAAGAPVIAADVRRVGTDRLEGTVTNGLPRPLVDAILAFNKQVYKLGTIAPGATVRVETAADQNLSSYLEARREAIPNLNPWQADSLELDRANPSDIVRVLMFSRSLPSRGPRLQSNPLGYLDLTGQLELGRPILVADVAAPAAALVLDAVPSPPRIDQTTLAACSCRWTRTRTSEVQRKAGSMWDWWWETWSIIGEELRPPHRTGRLGGPAGRVARPFVLWVLTTVDLDSA